MKYTLLKALGMNHRLVKVIKSVYGRFNWNSKMRNNTDEEAILHIISRPELEAVDSTNKLEGCGHLGSMW